MTSLVGLNSEEQLKVIEFHRNDDLNGRPESHHHDLGNTRNQASPGNHIHDGITSAALLAGVVFTGSRGSDTANVLNQVLNALSAIGATNSTGS